MALFTRNRLGRALKWTRQAAYNLASSVAATMSTAGLQRDNYEQQWVPFHVRWANPILDWRLTGNPPVTTDGPLVPQIGLFFVLPPFQEFFQSSLTTLPTTPQMILDSFTLSWDQRGEAAGISGDTAGANYGKSDLALISRYRMQISLKDKAIGSAAKTPEREIFSVDIPAEAFSAQGFRFNPFVLQNINKELHPYRSYFLEVKFPDLNEAAAANMGAVPSLCLELNCRHPMVARDSGAANVQNLPTVHNGAKSTQAVTVTLPGIGGTMLAAGASGWNTAMRTLDQLLLSKLEGGYRKESDVPNAEFLGDDSGYEVIVVPLWQAIGLEGAATANNAIDLPYVDVGLTSSIDLRMLDINYPLVIHHVFAAINYAKPAITGGTGMAVSPARAGTIWSAGLGMGRGIRADEFDYQPIAFRTWNASTRVGLLDEYQPAPAQAVVNTGDHAFELYSVPLKQRGAEVGTGFATQGRPVFVGKATNKTGSAEGGATMRRSNIGDNAGASVAPATQGMEQWLEARLTLEDAGGLGTGGGTPQPANTTFAGMGGHALIIIAKKTAVRPTGDIPV